MKSGTAINFPAARRRVAKVDGLTHLRDGRTLAAQARRYMRERNYTSSAGAYGCAVRAFEFAARAFGDDDPAMKRHAERAAATARENLAAAMDLRWAH